MNNLYFGSVFMAAIAYAIMAGFLLLQRKEGERSRTILGCFALISVFNYALRIGSMLGGEMPALVVSPPMLILAIFMVTCYILYPVEVVSPNWLRPKRILLLYSPVLFFTLVWLVSLAAGVEYKPYSSLFEMLPHIWRFDVWFRVLLLFMIFIPLPFIFFIPYSKKYGNTNKVWMRGYSIAFCINSLAYIAALSFESAFVHTAYYYFSVGCALYIVYKELFVRIIVHPGQMQDAESDSLDSLGSLTMREEYPPIKLGKNAALFERLDKHIRQGSLWRDPNISMSLLVKNLSTNRTTLSLSISEQGYENYADYINKLRVNEFVAEMTSGKYKGFLECFFDVGFRSKSAALRNFRKVTGKTPSEYFKETLH